MATWQKVELPPLERVALAELAEKRGETEEKTLSGLIREAVRRELLASPTETGRRKRAQPAGNATGGA